MLVLVIQNIETSIVFVFNLRHHIFPGVTKIIYIYTGFLNFSRNLRPIGQVPWKKLELVGMLVAWKFHYSLRVF